MSHEYRCKGIYKDRECHRLLFCGSLRLILSRAAQPKDAIEIKCPKCGHLNVFVPQPEVLKLA